MNKHHIYLIVLATFICLTVARPTLDNSKEIEKEESCKNLCSHCGCTGFYCGDECICECNGKESEGKKNVIFTFIKANHLTFMKFILDMECVITMQSNCEKLNLPFEVLIQGPSENRVVRSLIEAEAKDKEICLKEDNSVDKESSDSRSTISIYKPEVKEQQFEILQSPEEHFRKIDNNLLNEFDKIATTTESNKEIDVVENSTTVFGKHEEKEIDPMFADSVMAEEQMEIGGLELKRQAHDSYVGDGELQENELYANQPLLQKRNVIEDIIITSDLELKEAISEGAEAAAVLKMGTIALDKLAIGMDKLALKLPVAFEAGALGALKLPLDLALLGEKFKLPVLGAAVLGESFKLPIIFDAAILGAEALKLPLDFAVLGEKIKWPVLDAALIGEKFKLPILGAAVLGESFKLPIIFDAALLGAEALKLPIDLAILGEAIKLPVLDTAILGEKFKFVDLGLLGESLKWPILDAAILGEKFKLPMLGAAILGESFKLPIIFDASILGDSFLKLEAAALLEKFKLPLNAALLGESLKLPIFLEAGVLGEKLIDFHSLGKEGLLTAIDLSKLKLEEFKDKIVGLVPIIAGTELAFAPIDFSGSFLGAIKDIAIPEISLDVLKSAFVLDSGKNILEFLGEKALMAKTLEEIKLDTFLGAMVGDVKGKLLDWDVKAALNEFVDKSKLAIDEAKLLNLIHKTL